MTLNAYGQREYMCDMREVDPRAWIGKDGQDTCKLRLVSRPKSIFRLARGVDLAPCHPDQPRGAWVSVDQAAATPTAHLCGTVLAVSLCACWPSFESPTPSTSPPPPPAGRVYVAEFTTPVQVPEPASRELWEGAPPRELMVALGHPPTEPSPTPVLADPSWTVALAQAARPWLVARKRQSPDEDVYLAGTAPSLITSLTGAVDPFADGAMRGTILELVCHEKPAEAPEQTLAECDVWVRRTTGVDGSPMEGDLTGWLMPADEGVDLHIPRESLWEGTTSPCTTFNERMGRPETASKEVVLSLRTGSTPQEGIATWCGWEEVLHPGYTASELQQTWSMARASWLVARRLPPRWQVDHTGRVFREGRPVACTLAPGPCDEAAYGWPLWPACIDVTEPKDPWVFLTNRVVRGWWFSGMPIRGNGWMAVEVPVTCKEALATGSDDAGGSQ